MTTSEMTTLFLSFIYSAEANIYPNEYDVCPEGYELDLVSGRWCNDVNECTQNDACSDGCVNTMGSFLCTCPDGYVIDFNGESCLDVDECTTGEFECGAGLSCANTPGSYKVKEEDLSCQNNLMYIISCPLGLAFNRKKEGIICFSL